MIMEERYAQKVWLYNEGALEEQGFVFSRIRQEDDRVKAYRLRHSVFAETLKWVPCSETELEMDEYDPFAIHFGVFDESGSLLAYLRLLMADRVYMLEREFQTTLNGGEGLRKEPSSCELTRFCVDRSARSEPIKTPFGEYPLFMLLFKGVYQWCMDNGIGIIYGVTDRLVYRLITMRGFPLRPLGTPVRMPDGVVALSFRLDWGEFRSLTSLTRPGTMEWFAQRSMSRLPSATAMA
jgi:N-acyl-L-homoserine lactone synthetase